MNPLCMCCGHGPDCVTTSLKLHVACLSVCLQSDDPGRDFRGAGLYGLDNLLYLGTQHPQLFKQLMLKTQVQDPTTCDAA